MSSPTTTERLEAKATASVELMREPVRAMLRRRLAEDDQRQRREIEADKERDDDGAR